MMKDLTVGKPSRVLLNYSLPMFVSVIFQQMYSIADSAIAGKFAGEDALAAIGASYPVTMIFMAIAIGCNIGCSVVISQLFGAKKYSEVHTAISTSIISSIILSAALTLLGIIITKPIMRLIKTPDNIFEDSAVYLSIYIGGFFFMFIYNVCTGIFQSLGNSKTPLYFLIGSSVGNVILDIIFVAGFNMSVAGVAWATFIAQGVACVLAFACLMVRIKKIPVDEKPHTFSSSALKSITKIAIPSVLQQSFVSIGNIFIQGIINGYGSSVVAGYSAAIKLNTFCITSLVTFSNGLSGFTAQNIGAEKPDRIRKGFRSGTIMVLCVAVPFSLIYFFAGNPIMHLFLTNGSATAYDTGVLFMRIVSPFYSLIALKILADGVLRGSGAMRQFMIATFADLVLRTILAFILSPKIGSIGIWISWPIGWALATVLSLAFYFGGKWDRMLS